MPLTCRVANEFEGDSVGYQVGGGSGKNMRVLVLVSCL